MASLVASKEEISEPPPPLRIGDVPSLMENEPKNETVVDDSGSDSESTTLTDLASIAADPVPERPLGLSITRGLGWSGSDYDDYDVVTVHGIRDDYKTAWTTDSGGWWVKNSLFDGLSIRQIDYSFDIDGESLLYQPGGLQRHAMKLLAELVKVRQALEETEADRPIIWISHDLGGVIVKEVLRLAMSNSEAYGKIGILTTAIIFVGTPHRFRSDDELKDQIHKLMHLPVPNTSITHDVPAKVDILASQVVEISNKFFQTKVPDRSLIFNIFAQNKPDSFRRSNLQLDPNDGSEVANAETPFTRYAHSSGHSFEAANRLRYGDTSHQDLVRPQGGESSSPWHAGISPLFNTSGSSIKVKYDLLPFQARLLSLSPAPRLGTANFDPLLPRPPIVQWLGKHKQFAALWLSRRSTPVHVHGNGLPHANLAAISRTIYVYFDSDVAFNANGQTTPQKSWVYFEFDAYDSRRNTIFSLLTYLINAIVWRFWANQSTVIPAELKFLDSTDAWTLEDLYHLYQSLRHNIRGVNQLTIFLGCFDQCDEGQRKWFVERTLEEQSYSDKPFRILFSTSAKDGLATDSFPDSARINMEEPLHSTSTDNAGIASQMRGKLDHLFSRRPVYRDWQTRLENFLDECVKSEVPELTSNIGLCWLERNHRGKTKHQIRDSIEKLFPPTPKNLLHAIISSTLPHSQDQVRSVFDWVRHAAEPWSCEALCQALAMRKTTAEEGPNFDDLDVKSTISGIVDTFCGILEIRDGEVRFSHLCFYQILAAHSDFDGDEDDHISGIHGSIAKECLRYIHSRSGRETMLSFFERNFEGGPWTTQLDAVVICQPRTSLTEYAVRFWPQHYRASGRFKPSSLVRRLFSDKEGRKAWDSVSWILSNPFTRIQRGYTSPLPTLAGLGLDDLVDEIIEIMKDDSQFTHNCWCAITEAARAGNLPMIQRLLARVTATDESELSVALHWAAAHANPSIVKTLLEQIPSRETFVWPPNIMHRAAAAGLNDLLAAVLLAGQDINETGDYWGSAPTILTAAFRNHVSTFDFLLNTEPRPLLNFKDGVGDSLLTSLLVCGNPVMVKLLLQANPESANEVRVDGMSVALTAVEQARHKALDLVIEAGAAINNASPSNENSQSPLMEAVNSGYLKCVRVLLARGADPNLETNTGTALYRAVVQKDLDIARLLLENDPKPTIDLTPSGETAILMLAISHNDIDLVTLLVENGATIDLVDQPSFFTKTPLALACQQGNLEIVKLLLAHNADINYTGDVSDSPFYSALMGPNVEVARYLLQDEKLDVFWTASDGVNALIAADRYPDIVLELLKRGLPIDSAGSLGTVLHSATRTDKTDTMKALLFHDPKPTIDCIFPDHGSVLERGFTPLQVACYYAHPEALELLLDVGADPSFRNANGDDALDILMRATSSILDRSQKCLKLLLRKQHNISVDQVNGQGRSRLHTAIRADTSVAMVQTMIDAGAPLNLQDQDGDTLLSLAVEAGNGALAKHLIEKGATVNIFAPSFGSILHIAVENANLDLAKHLVAWGADVDAVHPDFGESILYTALGIPDLTSRTQMVRYLVTEAHAPVNKAGGTEFRYPIIRAASSLRDDRSVALRIFKFLIKKKADVNVADHQGRRAMHVACTSSDPRGMRLLIKHGAEIDVQDNLGRRPLHFLAASTHFHDNLETLLRKPLTGVDGPDSGKHGQGVNDADHDGWTPLLWAARAGADRGLEALVELGSDVWVRGESFTGGQWSALKLYNSVQYPVAPNADTVRLLQPKVRTRTNSNGESEEWDDEFHSNGGKQLSFSRYVTCKSCFWPIKGFEWKCLDCSDEKPYSLCFKCFSHRTEVHNPDHTFEQLGPEYAPALPIMGEDGPEDGTRVNIPEIAVRYDETDLDQPDKVGDVTPRPESPDEESVFNLDDIDEAG